MQRFWSAFLVFTLLACQQASFAARNSSSADSGSAEPALYASGALQSLNSRSLDPTMAYLLYQLSTKPELMNLEYLKYFLGDPQRQTNQIGIRSHAYYWYQKFRAPSLELYQERNGAGEVQESVFIVNLPQSDLDFDLLKDKLGVPLRSHFDHSGFPTQLYSFAPFTTLSLASPPNTFCVRKATVSYLGPPLAKPSAEDMQIAHESFMFRKRNENKNKTNWQEELLVAKERLKMNPQSAEHHAANAEALRKTGNLHDAITEYKTALMLAQNNELLRQQCFDALRELHVPVYDPASAAQYSKGVAKRNELEYSHGGQRLKLAGSESRTSN